jgi:hypothetical protein
LCKSGPAGGAMLHCSMKGSEVLHFGAVLANPVYKIVTVLKPLGVSNLPRCIKLATVCKTLRTTQTLMRKVVRSGKADTGVLTRRG